MRRSKLKILGLILLTTAVFFPSLLNDFSGDDAGFLKQSTFYDNPANISRLITKDYNVQPEESVYRNLENSGTGSVAYRPALSLTYFIDKGILTAEEIEGLVNRSVDHNTTIRLKNRM